MAADDERVRADLARDGAPFRGYHSRIQEVHERNARRLHEVVLGDGWPGITRVGRDGAEAAWKIAQHAISWPAFMREALAALEIAADIGEAPRWQVAYLVDRIRTMEGREQVYGTQLDWNKEGEMVPSPIENEAEVDGRRAAAGLRPLAQVMAERRARAKQSGEKPPVFSERTQQEFLEWARSAGWR